jgi:hypothetical protein
MPNHLPDTCDKCGCTARTLLETRRPRRQSHIRRRYRCDFCGHKWSTHEVLAIDSTQQQELMSWILTSYDKNRPAAKMLRAVLGQRDSDDCANYPLDINHLAECILLAEKVSLVADNLIEKVSKIDDNWFRIICNWPQLCFLLDQEAPAWRRSICTIRAPHTLALLRSCP